MITHPLMLASPDYIIPPYRTIIPGGPQEGQDKNRKDGEGHAAASEEGSEAS
jgi:hypothetical protein